MYLCGGCQRTVSGPLQRHIIYREVQGPTRIIAGKPKTSINRQIEREIPICNSCQSALDNGVPLVILQRQGAIRLEREKEARRLERQQRKAQERVVRVQVAPPSKEPVQFQGVVVKYSDIKKGTKDA